METRRSILTRTVGAGALISMTGVSALLTAARTASAADERRQERAYPRIHSALEALRSAREELNAAGDFHGHKDAAMRAVDEAIRQLQILVEDHPH